MTDATFRMSLEGAAGALAVLLGTNEMANRLTASRALSARWGERTWFIHSSTDPGLRRSTSARGCVMESCLEVTLAPPSSLPGTEFCVESLAMEHSRRRASNFLKSIARRSGFMDQSRR